MVNVTAAPLTGVRCLRPERVRFENVRSRGERHRRRHGEAELGTLALITKLLDEVPVPPKRMPIGCKCRRCRRSDC